MAKRLDNRNQYVHMLAMEWVRWLDTRRFLGQAPQKNILGLLQGGNRSGVPPDARLSAELSAFNLAVTGLEIGHFVPFVVVYCDYKPKPIKAIAHEIGISRSVFYDRAEKAARDIQRTTQTLMGVHKMMQRELGLHDE